MFIPNDIKEENIFKTTNNLSFLMTIREVNFILAKHVTLDYYQFIF